MNMNRFVQTISWLLPAVLTAFPWTAHHAVAQTRPYNEEITVIATFDPIIPDAFKINQNPVLNDTTTVVPVMTYSVVPRDAAIRLEIDPLPAVKLVAEPLTKIYRNYLKAGVGNYSTLYGELFASSLRSKTHLLGVHMKHLSSSGKIKEYGPSSNSTQLAEVYGQRYFDQHTLGANVFFRRDGLHLYGFKPADFPDTSIGKNDIRQRYLRAGAETSFSSRYKSNDKLNHSIGLSYHFLADYYKVRENIVSLDANLNKQYDLFGWEQKQTLGLNTSFDFLNQKDSNSRINSGILSLQPNISGRFNEYSFKAGVGLSIAMDTNTNAYVFPMLEGRIDLIQGALQIFAGIDGGMERNSTYALSERNPYLSSELPLNYTIDKFRAYGGFSSNISRSFNFNASISSQTFENYAFFVTDTLNYLKNSFTLLYDDISVMKIKAELEYLRKDKLRLALNGSYNKFYKLLFQEKAWYQPETELEFTASYNMQDKIMIKFQTGYHGPAWALVPSIPGDASQETTLAAEKIKGWVDINLGAEYRFNKALSFWLNINNILGKQHLYWYNYPTYKFNLLGGVSYSF